MKTKQQVIDDGKQAQRLLDDTDLKRFLAEIEQDCWREFKATCVSDEDNREAVDMERHGVDLVQQSLRAMADNATIEMKYK